jgi:hypothetical protein
VSSKKKLHNALVSCPFYIMQHKNPEKKQQEQEEGKKEK